MIDFILEHKWLILVISEILFWLSFIIFLILRYWYNSRIQLFFLGLSIVNQFLNIPLAALDYIYTGHASLFHFIVLFIYGYAILRGPKDMLHLDHYIQKITEKWKNQTPYRGSTIIRSTHTSDFINYYSTMLRKKFYIHLLLFVFFQVILLPFSNYHLTNLKTVWLFALLIDGLWSMTFRSRTIHFKAQLNNK
ncbi:hypothetical protein [Aquibacillus rhizosphaerae]|uniref:Glycosyl-4,4'-diaponeurosporenoate acyltransferase n=1 Tax=Aquibacillus rhizosphaerae TaxID=3051431 RepID=A0ABT7L5E8_9BACI|nr:hypothetical protein [Aquibacillus sp. LR5S19]MDL4841079.1 hypothetical protein [Aquibacillus sp. LR5S19]